MAQGITPLLPLSRGEKYGFYHLIEDYPTLARQNLKMLVMTIPGERVMDPEFGVGLRRYLFESATSDIYDKIRERLLSQVQKYLPYIQILAVDYSTPENQPDLFPHSLTMQITFKIIPIQKDTVLILQVDQN